MSKAKTSQSLVGRYVLVRDLEHGCIFNWHDMFGESVDYQAARVYKDGSVDAIEMDNGERAEGTYRSFHPDTQVVLVELAKTSKNSRAGAKQGAYD